jgi:hypothetical protein
MSNELYTASRLRVFRQCNRAHFYRYSLGIRTPSSPAMAFGTHAHSALEAWYRAWQIGADRLQAALQVIDALEQVDDIDRVRLRVLIAAYEARWGVQDWEVLAVEIEFRYFLGDIEIGGKIDAIIRERATGKVFVVEHKTSTADTTAGSPYWDRLAIDTQVSVYIDGAAFGLDYEVAGCIYDVLKRPQHEPLRATPEEKRKYTVGKGCKKCGGSAKPGEVSQGKGFYVVTFTTVEEIKCEDCDGTGWKKDKTGKPEAPRLHSDQRTEDESLDEFEDRLTDEVASRIDDFLSRGVVVRLDGELPRMRQELIDTITAMRALDAAGIAPPNHDACVRGRDTCAFFAACSGRASIDDPYIYPRGSVHSELASVQTAEAA